MDKEVHRNEVALGGVALTHSACHAPLLSEGWRTLAVAESEPESHKHRDDLFVPDRSKVYGVLLKSPGKPYGPEINGPGQGPAKSEDYLAFQQTPAFQALKATATLDAAIEGALSAYWRRPFKRVQSSVDLSPQQIAFWMRDLSEVLLIDFILNQQDRIGNISSKPYYYWLEYGGLRRKKAKGDRAPGQGGVPNNARLIHRTHLNDNDAGARVEYKNPSRDEGLLASIRHFDQKLYHRLIDLNEDLQEEGPVYQWLGSSVGLNETDVDLIATNTMKALKLLRANCQAGLLQFDLRPEEYFAMGTATRMSPAC